MPFQVRTWIETLIRSIALPIGWTLPRLGTFLFFLLVFPWLELANAVTLLMDHVFFPGFRRIEVKNPVFIVGNARSGTTFMHRLMALDREQFNAFKLSDLIFVSVGAKKFFQALGRFDRAVLGGALQQGLENLQGRLMKSADKIHKLRLSQPEEDEGVLIHVFASTFLALIFPVPIMQRWNRFDELPEALRHRIFNYYKACIQRQIYCNGGNAMMLLSKNPLFSTKIKTIFEIFPDARVIYMARSPYETVASVHNMVDRIWSVQLPMPKDAPAREGLTQVCIYSYRYALSELDRHPQGQSIIVKYEDLVERPEQVVHNIYSKFNLRISPQFQAELTRVVSKNKGYKSEHHYSLEQFGLSKERVYRETKDVFDRFGFDPEGEFAGNKALAAAEVREG